MTTLPAWRRILGRLLPPRRTPCRRCGWPGGWRARFDNRPAPSDVAHQCFPFRPDYTAADVEEPTP